MNETALKERIKQIAKHKGITFNQCWKSLLLERVLARISKSKHSEKFIFKGGFFLSYAIDIGRETVDLDFLLTKSKGEQSEIRTIFEEITGLTLADGFSFSWDGIEELAQPHMNYPGFRISLNAAIGKMRDKVQVDLGIGDAVEPEKKKIILFHYRDKPIFEDEITLLTYPLETVFAEKLETLISRGALNSRMKDYHDLLVLCRSGRLRVKKLRAAIKATFIHRETEQRLPIRFSTMDIEKLQSLWFRHAREHNEAAYAVELPGEISRVVQEINKHLP